MIPSIVQALPTAKYTILVVDIDGVPIEKANVRLGFMKSASGGWKGKSYFVSGQTDEEGLFTGKGGTERYATYSANMDGYYSTGIKFNKFTGIDGVLGFRKWQPWNPTLKVILKKKIKSIAMFAYKVDGFRIPKNNESIGYDLVKHDWVFPHGKGVTADFLFKLDYLKREGNGNRTLFKLDFSNETDGIQAFSTVDSQGSNFRSSHHAPISSYKNGLKQGWDRESGKAMISSYKTGDGTNYYFRVRCEDNEPDTCLYGKIYGNLEFAGTTLSFTYYLNPTQGDTNVEFDPDNNLFKGLEATINGVDRP